MRRPGKEGEVSFPVPARRGRIGAMTEYRRRIWQISTTAILFALGTLVVLRNYDDLPMRVAGTASFAFVAYFVIWEAGKRR